MNSDDEMDDGPILDKCPACGVLVLVPAEGVACLDCDPGDEPAAQGDAAAADPEQAVEDVVAAWVAVKAAGLAYDEHMDPEVAELARALDRLAEVAGG